MASDQWFGNSFAGKPSALYARSKEGAPQVVQRTQVGIVGAGPAGLFLSCLLARAGIESVVIEDRSRSHVETRVRAGVLEQGSVDLLTEAGLGQRLQREGLCHEGIGIRFGGQDHRIDFRALTGKAITVYAQHELVKDLIADRLAAGGPIHFEVSDVAVEGLAGDRPVLRPIRLALANLLIPLATVAGVSLVP